MTYGQPLLYKKYLKGRCNNYGKENNEEKWLGVSSLIHKHGVYSTTPHSKWISFPYGDGYKYIPKTQANLREIMAVKGKPEVFDDKRYGKRLIWL